MKLMRHALLLFVVFALVAPFASADESAGKQHAENELRLFDPCVFGKTPSDSVALLLPGTQMIQPRCIQVDLQDGRYFAATITYDKVAFEIARRSLNNRYKKYELQDFANGRELALWRNTKGKYAIQLSSFDDEDELRIIYIQFQPLSTVLENMRKAGVAVCPEFEQAAAESAPQKPEPGDEREPE